MVKYTKASIPDVVSRGTLDPELSVWLKDALRLGAHEPIHTQPHNSSIRSIRS